MARVRKPAVIFSFEKTIDAMAVEKHCMAKGLPGRLIPVPTQITAGCGLAWKAEPDDEKRLVEELTEAGMSWSGIYHMEI